MRRSKLTDCPPPEADQVSDKIDGIFHPRYFQWSPVALDLWKSLTTRRFRFLFCVPTTQLSGGVKVVFTIADRMTDAGHEVDVFSWADSPEWCSLRSRLLPVKDISAIEMSHYDFVVVSNAMLIPMVLPVAGTARCVFLALDYEAFHHSQEIAYESFLEDSPIFKELYGLPVPIIATSKPIQRLVQERIGKPAYVIPLGIDKKVFRPVERATRPDRKRILLVGNYLMPYKGMRDGLKAIDALSREMPVQLVLVTQEERGRKIFDGYRWPVEIHFCPGESHVPGIMATCDVYCCTSWYEGLGLPAMEAFCCGTPVVSTRTLGVDDYAEDGTNLLLADPNDPVDLARQLRRVLTEPGLSEHLVAGGYETMAERYDWSTSISGFTSAIEDIHSSYAAPENVDRTRMRFLLAELERSGSLTPIEVFRVFQILADRLHRICSVLAAAPAGSLEMGELAAVRDQLQPHLQNERAQYYEAFKAKFDFCQLVLALAGTADSVLIRTLAERHIRPPDHTHASPFAEIRYPQR